MVRGVEVAKGFDKLRATWPASAPDRARTAPDARGVTHRGDRAARAARSAQVDPGNPRANGGGQMIDTQGRLGHEGVLPRQVALCGPMPTEWRWGAA